MWWEHNYKTRGERSILSSHYRIVLVVRKMTMTIEREACRCLPADHFTSQSTVAGCYKLDRLKTLEATTASECSKREPVHSSCHGNAACHSNSAYSVDGITSALSVHLCFMCNQLWTQLGRNHQQTASRSQCILHCTRFCITSTLFFGLHSISRL